MKIRNFIHKGLKKLYTDDIIRSVPPESVDKLRKILAFLDDMDEIEELKSMPSWKVLTVTAAAEAIGVSRPTLSSLLNGKAGLSGEMALRLEKAFGIRMDTLMRMQSSYEIAETRKREKQIKVRAFALVPASS